VRRSWPILLALLGGCAALSSLFREPYPYRVAPGSVKVEGPAARAVGVAFEHYLDHLAAEHADLMAWDPDAGGPSPEELEQIKPQWDCVENPKGYDVWYRLEDGGTRYIVEIYTKPEVCFDAGRALLGGGALYEIDAKSFTILKKDLEDVQDLNEQPIPRGGATKNP